MPYKLRKAPKKELYWVVTSETGKKHSKDPIAKDKAQAQKRILEQALREELKGGSKWQHVRLIAEEIKKVKKRNAARFKAVAQASGPVNPYHIGPVRGSEVRGLEPIPDIDVELQKLVKKGFIDKEDVSYFKEKLEAYLIN
jgi:hypothetical protein